MTNTWTMAKVLTRQRFKTALNTFIVTIVAAIITAILVYFGGDSQLSAQFFFSMLSPYVLFGSIYLFIRLAIKQEHTWVNNYYRAVPTTNLKLYVANLFSTVANFAFYCIIEGLVLGGLELSGRGMHLPTASAWPDIIEGAIIIALTCLFIWAFVSLVHMLSVTIMAFLPETRIRIVQWGIYLVVIVIASYLFNQLQRLLFMPLHTYNFGAVIAVFLIIFTLISAINVYLLEKWVETK